MLRDIPTSSARLNSAIIPCIRRKPKQEGIRRVQFTEEGAVLSMKVTDQSYGFGKETEKASKIDAKDTEKIEGGGKTTYWEFIYLERGSIGAV